MTRPKPSSSRSMTFWDARGLTQEARGWVDRCRAVLEAADGRAPDLDTEAGALWLFMVEAEAERARAAGDLAAAEATYDAIRKNLEGAAKGETRDRRLSVIYHQLGIIAQDRGELGAAEAWYKKSLEIKEALGDRPGMASSYHQLGIVAQDRGQLGAVADWHKKVPGDHGNAGGPAENGADLPPTRHGRAASRRVRGGGGLVQEVP